MQNNRSIIWNHNKIANMHNMSARQFKCILMRLVVQVQTWVTVGWHTVNTPSRCPSLTNTGNTEASGHESEMAAFTRPVVNKHKVTLSQFNAESPLYPAIHHFHYGSYHFRRGYIIYLLPCLCLEGLVWAGELLLKFILEFSKCPQEREFSLSTDSRRSF